MLNRRVYLHAIDATPARWRGTQVSVMEATRACPYAFPKKIQEEFDTLADEQMLKLKELARRDSLLSSD